MNSLQPAFTPFHPAAGLRRLLVVVLAVLLLGVFTTLPALASGSGTWTVTGSLHLARWEATATLLQNGQVLVAGGCCSAAPAELYTPSTGTWTTTGSTNVGRWRSTATLLSNGQVLVAGGEALVNNQYVLLASAELYNPSTGTWTTTGSMHTARDFHTATLLQNGQVLVAGGLGNTSALSSAELYNPSTGTWTTTGSMSTVQAFSTATLLTNGQVLVAGGTDSAGNIIASAELYTPSTGAWSTTGSLNQARDEHTATLLQNGQVLVAGGESRFAFLTSAELYTPSTGTWTTTGSMHTGRLLHTATLLSNGQVLVAGGQPSADLGCPNDTASAELYTPSTGAWSTTGSLNQARDEHTATLLTNGQVLVAGGEFNEPDCVSTTFLNSAELYTP